MLVRNHYALSFYYQSIRCSGVPLETFTCLLPLPLTFLPVDCLLCRRGQELQCNEVTHCSKDWGDWDGWAGVLLHTLTHSWGKDETTSSGHSDRHCPHQCHRQEPHPNICQTEVSVFTVAALAVIKLFSIIQRGVVKDQTTVSLGSLLSRINISCCQINIPQLSQFWVCRHNRWVSLCLHALTY